MLLLKANIPDFLKSSLYLQSLLSNGPFPEEGLEIPDRSGKQDLTVNSKADLIELLSTLRFWLVPEVAEQSSDLLRFAFSPTSKTDFVEVVKTEFRNDLPLVDELLQIVNSKEEDKLEIAARFGRVSVLQFLCENVGLKQTSQAACVAAGEGHLNCLTYLHSRGAELNNNTIQAAGHGGHFNCAKYIVNNSSVRRSRLVELACRVAAKCGHFACVQQMLAEWGEQHSKFVMYGAAAGGYLDILQLAVECEHDEASVQQAVVDCAVNGHLECLQYLHSLGDARPVNVMQYTAGEGHLHCLKFLHEHNYPAGERVCYAAAEYGHLECLKYAHEQCMYWNQSTCLAAAQGGHLECLQYAHEHGCSWNAEVCCYAGTIECYDYAEHKAWLSRCGAEHKVP